MLKLILGGLSGLSMPLNSGAPPDVAISSVDTGMILRSARDTPSTEQKRGLQGRSPPVTPKLFFYFW